MAMASPSSTTAPQTTSRACASYPLPKKTKTSPCSSTLPARRTDWVRVLRLGCAGRSSFEEFEAVAPTVLDEDHETVISGFLCRRCRWASIFPRQCRGGHGRDRRRALLCRETRD